MAEPIHRTATCGCGALCATTLGAPTRTMLCSCRSCQQRTGTAVGISGYWSEADVTLNGPSTSWVRDCQGGRHAEHHFCPTCGTTLWWTADFAQGLIGIAGGCFEDGNFLEPTIAYWASCRPAWVSDMNKLKTLDGQTR